MHTVCPSLRRGSLSSSVLLVTFPDILIIFRICLKSSTPLLLFVLVLMPCFASSYHPFLEPTTHRISFRSRKTVREVSCLVMMSELHTNTQVSSHSSLLSETDCAAQLDESADMDETADEVTICRLAKGKISSSSRVYSL